ncbi:MAG TPA: DUF1015 domain-containing protein [Acetivibrio sp.]|nr:DUF1015 domain-containing protein [Acetivibrio sp.]
MTDIFPYDKNLGIQIPSIMLPKKGVDMTLWSVVACDQYTSEPEYWNKVNEIVGDNPSTLRLTFPEVYLGDGSETERIKKINSEMKKYISEGTLVSDDPCMIFVDRKTSHVQSRKGLILSVDLEKYDYTKGSQTLIRATENTVIDRLPPRIKIRENASLELPHVMLLIDDPQKTVIEPLEQKLDSFEKVYDFELMMNGGHLKGYKINDQKTLDGIFKAINDLADPQAFRDKYGLRDDKGVLLFAVGDGNHSLASAKGHWENVKKNLSAQERENHPARFALVEVVNVHDDGITFEPIHRVLFNIDPEAILKDMADYFEKYGGAFEKFDSLESMKNKLSELTKDRSCHNFGFVNASGFGVFTIRNPECNLEVATLQCFLDDFIKSNRDSKIDYIHGEDVVTRLGSKAGNIGFYLPAMRKHDLFKTVILDGVLPRKTFSMGEAEEKRFYLECRRIVKD